MYFKAAGLHGELRAAWFVVPLSSAIASAAINETRSSVHENEPCAIGLPKDSFLALVQSEMWNDIPTIGLALATRRQADCESLALTGIEPQTRRCFSAELKSVHRLMLCASNQVMA
ncbi:hypothetical protein [Sinorhizobium fredii]|uniref:hypothetical protein n=1 Tax=Rhizobium fredii TaxID=380 RepID=UPI001294A6AA|nr:hypothetical protein [Sinorhizobium fredii]MQW96970.1 hypothetical protein [Sinorhizobium fredii]